MKLRLTKEFVFQMAHTLSAYDGKCRNIHGHNYKLYVTIEGSVESWECNAPGGHDPECRHMSGMVMDYSDIKRIVEQNIIDLYDHAFVVPCDSPFSGLTGTKLVVLPFQPTCENLLSHFYSILSDKFPDNVKLYSLKLYESDSSFAELIDE